MTRKKRALFMTVGTGFKDNQKSLAHGLMCSIVSKDPDLICFFGSKKSKSTIDTLKQIFNESNDEYDDEPYFMFDANESIDDLKDDYYDKYKFMVGGYGIYLDKDLNVEYGYYTTEAPACGHGAGYTEFYDFKDARDDDIIKEKIYSLLDSSGIWK